MAGKTDFWTAVRAGFAGVVALSSKGGALIKGGAAGKAAAKAAAVGGAAAGAGAGATLIKGGAAGKAAVGTVAAGAAAVGIAASTGSQDGVPNTPRLPTFALQRHESEEQAKKQTAGWFGWLRRG